MVGVLMIVYVLVGGMKGTTYVQMIKAVLLIIGAAVMTFWVLGMFGFNLSALLGDAAAASPKGEAVLAPGLQYGATPTAKIDFISLGLALVLGTAGLPHILMRFYTVPTAQGGPPLGGLGDLADRPVLPVHAGPGLRRGVHRRAGRRSPPRPAG